MTLKAEGAKQANPLWNIGNDNGHQVKMSYEERLLKEHGNIHAAAAAHAARSSATQG